MAVTHGDSDTEAQALHRPRRAKEDIAPIAGCHPTALQTLPSLTGCSWPSWQAANVPQESVEQGAKKDSSSNGFTTSSMP